MKEAVDTGQLLHEVSTFGLHGSTCTGKVDLAPDLWRLYADAGQIHQALSNMIINALHSMPDGGLLTITAANELIDAGDDRPLPAGRYVKIEVTDQGCGIPPEILTRIFDPYFTTKPEGTGLGLASVFSIVRRHGGAIDVASTPGKGTTFTLLLPAAEDTVPEKRVRPEDSLPPTPVPPGGSILVMDDDEMIRVVAVAMLDKLGFKAVTCADGAEAVTMYRQSREKGERFAAVILDMTVPGGMGGKEAALKSSNSTPKRSSLSPPATLSIRRIWGKETRYSVAQYRNPTTSTSCQRNWSG